MKKIRINKDKLIWCIGVYSGEFIVDVAFDRSGGVLVKVAPSETNKLGLIALCRRQLLRIVRQFDRYYKYTPLTCEDGRIIPMWSFNRTAHFKRYVGRYGSKRAKWILKHNKEMIDDIY